jgi:hypothetical protein
MKVFPVPCVSINPKTPGSESNSLKSPMFPQIQSFKCEPENAKVKHYVSSGECVRVCKQFDVASPYVWFLEIKKSLLCSLNKK